MQLTRQLVSELDGNKIIKPNGGQFLLPEKILQFGTGVLLRGLCDYYVDRANRSGIFNGRIVVVKSTSSGSADAFEQQDNLYTICVRGVNNGQVIKEDIICSAISRVINASNAWQDVLRLASKPELNVIISNTTEVGLQLVKEAIEQEPPASYPAKLLAFLYRRYEHFKEGVEGSMVVIPTELITGNGDKLQAIVEELAIYNRLDDKFLEWMQNRIIFCNSLVDRIVTKDPGEKMIRSLYDDLGYEDDLLTMCEDYNLWAIQGDERIKSILSFTADDAGAFVKPDIEIYRSLKLHMLNGTHTLSASLAFLSGFDTVKEAMHDAVFRDFISRMMFDEISTAIPQDIDEEEKKRFGKKVLDRFSNPFLQHQWLNITLQNTTKMRMRNMPVLKVYAARQNVVPIRMATGFAAYILFMRGVKSENGQFYGLRKGEYYRINDDHAAYFYNLWQELGYDPARLVSHVLQDTALWEYDLDSYGAFRHAVVERLSSMLKNGVHSTLIP